MIAVTGFIKLEDGKILFNTAMSNCHPANTMHGNIMTPAISEEESFRVLIKLLVDIYC